MKSKEPKTAATTREVKGGERVVRKGLFDWPSEKPSLIGQRCKKCGNVFFPRRFICPSCFEEGTLEETHLSRTGKLYTFCILEKGPLGFEAPYALGYVDLPEGLRIYSMLKEGSIDRLKIGMEMELVVEKIREDSEGNAIIGYKFKPVL
jgi:uncharacterized OB-fold protein